MLKHKYFLAFKLSNVIFYYFTIVGILTLMSRINFSSDELSMKKNYLGDRRLKGTILVACQDINILTTQYSLEGSSIKLQRYIFSAMTWLI